MIWKIRVPEKYRVPPDDFTGKPFEWAKSQTAHIAVGLFLVIFLSLAGFDLWGEFPVKRHMLAVIVLGYIFAFKLPFQGWQGFETIEDTVFVAGYGAAGTLWASAEMEVGNTTITMDLDPLRPFLYVCVAHLIAGAVWRVRQRA